MRKSARHRAMDLLARREHSRAELLRKLTGKGLDAEEAESAIAALHAEGLQSDARYADSFVAARARRGQGPVRIRADLRAAGVEESLIVQALESGSLDWAANARAVVEKRFGTEAARSYPDKAKRMRFLQQRGFDMDTIHKALDGVEETDP